MKIDSTAGKAVWTAALATAVNLGIGWAQQEGEDPRNYLRHADFPNWEVNGAMPNDVFRFARLRYDSYGGRWGGGKWRTDYPDSDLNFSFRLQQLTSMEVHPDPVVVDIDAEQLKRYPFIYMIEPGEIYLSTREAKILRDYLLNGGFIMVDDFWGDREWNGFYEAFKKIFPKREPRELALDHPIFRAVFELKEKPQVPAISQALMARDMGTNWTHEWQKPGSETPHYKGVFDDKGRMMMIICHNTDLGDGWEREGENEWYFREFSEKKSFPMGINIVFYALTH